MSEESAGSSASRLARHYDAKYGTERAAAGSAIAPRN